MTRSTSGALTALALLLAACGGPQGAADGGSAEPLASGLDQVPDAGPCDRITGPGSTAEWLVESTCIQCSTESPEQAADGDLSTAALLVMPLGAGPGGATLRVTAPPGVVFPAGTIAGADFSSGLETLGAVVLYTPTLRTLLGGVVQEQSQLNAVLGTRAQGFESQQLTATKPYDAIEFYARLGASSAASEVRLRINELCNNLE